MLCYWPVVKDSLVLLVSTLCGTKTWKEGCWGVGGGREVCREKDMVVVRERDPMFPALSKEAVFLLLLQYSTFSVILCFNKLF